MDIITQASDNRRIHFFRNTEQTDWFFVKNFRDSSATEFYLRTHHLPPHENSAYVDLPIEWAFALEVEEMGMEAFLHFIRYQKGIKRGDPADRGVRWIGENGWYEFPDLENIDNWLNDFCEFVQQQRIIQSQKVNTNGLQTSLF